MGGGGSVFKENMDISVSSFNVYTTNRRHDKEIFNIHRYQLYETWKLQIKEQGVQVLDYNKWMSQSYFSPCRGIVLIIFGNILLHTVLWKLIIEKTIGKIGNI